MFLYNGPVLEPCHAAATSLKLLTSQCIRQTCCFTLSSYAMATNCALRWSLLPIIALFLLMHLMNS